MEILFATDGLPPARAAGELLRRLADPEPGERHDPVFQELAEAAVDDSVVRGLEDAGTAFRGAGIATHVLRMTGDPVGSIEKALAGQGLRTRCPGCWEPSLARSARVRQCQHPDAARVSGARAPGPPDTGPRHMSDSTCSSARTGHRRPRPRWTRWRPSLSRTASTFRFGPSCHTPELGFSAHPGAYVPTKYIEGFLAAEKAAAKRAPGRDARSSACVGVHRPWQSGRRLARERPPLLRRAERGGPDRGRSARTRDLGTDDDGLGKRPCRETCAGRPRCPRPAQLAESEPIEEPDGLESMNRYAVRWG